MKIPRRDFFVGAAALALTGTAAATWLYNTGIAFGVAPEWYALEGEGTETQRQRIFRGIVAAVLPFEDPQFPQIGAAEIEQRVYELFQLNDSPLFRRALVLFNDITIYPHLSDAGLAFLASPHDHRLHQDFLRSTDGERRFLDLPATLQRDYFKLWIRSEMRIKRRFYQTMKAVIVAAAYSSERTWAAIDYAGPALVTGSRLSQ